MNIFWWQSPASQAINWLEVVRKGFKQLTHLHNASTVELVNIMWDENWAALQLTYMNLFVIWKVYPDMWRNVFTPIAVFHNV